LESERERIPLHGVSERRRAIYNRENMAIVAFAKSSMMNKMTSLYWNTVNECKICGK